MGEVTLQGRGRGRGKGRGLGLGLERRGWGPAHPGLFFLEPQNSILVQLQLLRPLRAWAVSQSPPFSPPCRPCVELGPLGGWARWSQRRELGSNPARAAPGCWDGPDPPPATTFHPQGVRHPQAWAWPSSPRLTLTLGEFLGAGFGDLPGAGSPE